MSHASDWKAEADRLDARLAEEKRTSAALREALGNAMSWVRCYHDAPAEAMKLEAEKLLNPLNGKGVSE